MGQNLGPGDQEQGPAAPGARQKMIRDLVPGDRVHLYGAVVQVTAPWYPEARAVPGWGRLPVIWDGERCAPPEEGARLAEVDHDPERCTDGKCPACLELAGYGPESAAGASTVSGWYQWLRTLEGTRQRIDQQLSVTISAAQAAIAALERELVRRQVDDELHRMQESWSAARERGGQPARNRWEFMGLTADEHGAWKATGAVPDRLVHAAHRRAIEADHVRHDYRAMATTAYPGCDECSAGRERARS